MLHLNVHLFYIIFTQTSLLTENLQLLQANGNKMPNIKQFTKGFKNMLHFLYAKCEISYIFSLLSYFDFGVNYDPDMFFQFLQ